MPTALPLPLPPPYGLVATPRFPFPALAACTRTAALGGPRETALACLQGARLALALLPPYALSAEQRRRRAEAALGWLAALVLPAAPRHALHALYAATAQGPSPALRDALLTLRVAAADVLPAAATAELAALAAAVHAALAPREPG
ncbi:MAG TPA: hypothetical protein VFS08_08680 [Gemmatimonadaceae bacterium]|nr:hypothetical protein [Gemmatimonadaceae bacterium]